MITHETWAMVRRTLEPMAAAACLVEHEGLNPELAAGLVLGLIEQ